MSSRLHFSVISNAAYQVSGIALQILIVPLLARSLSTYDFGLYALFQALFAYLCIVVDFGLQWNGTQLVSSSIHSLASVASKLSARFYLQIGISILISVAIFALPLVFFFTSAAWSIFPPLTLALLGYALFPLWVFIGLEKVHLAASIQIVNRLCMLTAFACASHFRLPVTGYLYIFSFSSVLAGVSSIILLQSDPNRVFRRVSCSMMLQSLRECLPFFKTSVLISLYTSLPPLVLGWLIGPASLAEFDIANKIRIAAQAPVGPISQAVFPRLSSLFVSNVEHAKHVFARSFVVVLILSLFSALSLYFLAPLLVSLVGGKGYYESTLILRWMSPIPVLMALSNFLNVQVVLASGNYSQFRKAVVPAAIAGLAITYPLTIKYKGLGTAQIYLICELCAALISIVFAYRTVKSKLLSGQ